MNPVLAARRAGVLLHVTSLPGRGPTGRLGADAWQFVDTLRAGGFSVWQVLPLGPADQWGSPYCLRSAYAGDPRLIDPDFLGRSEELPRHVRFAPDPEQRLEAFRSFRRGGAPEQLRAFTRFVRSARRWLVPYGLFELCSMRFGGDPWWLWPEPLKRADGAALRTLRGSSPDAFRALLFEQYLFELQWSSLKRYANERGVFLFGDLPFYVDWNSVEVWWRPDLFRLDEAGRPLAVAGVPPDYFNSDGQLWGNPLYDWERMRADGFAWWLARLAGQLARFDVLRIDHFRALESYWEVPYGAPTAREGVWRHGAGDELLKALRERLGDLPLVAEDLGMITAGVHALRDRFGLPGMAVLQFAFDGQPDNPHLPANHVENSVVYTGTHDNDTTLGWYAKLTEQERGLVHAALGAGEAAKMPDLLIDAAYASRARLAVIPMQDLLALDSASRMNVPGTPEGNWRWRFEWPQLTHAVASRALQRAQQYSRLG